MVDLIFNLVLRSGLNEIWPVIKRRCKKTAVFFIMEKNCH